MKASYEHYRVAVSTHPVFWGDEATEEQGRVWAARLADMIRARFPGVNVNITTSDDSVPIPGEDENIADEINQWVQEHWTDAMKD